MTPALAALLDAVNTAVTRLRSVDLSEGCNTCEGLDSNAVHRVADDLEHAARRSAAVREEMAARNERLVRVRFDGPPSHESGRLIEVEDATTGKSLRLGEWVQDGSDWLLVFRAVERRVRGL